MGTLSCLHYIRCKKARISYILSKRYLCGQCVSSSSSCSNLCSQFGKNIVWHWLWKKLCVIDLMNTHCPLYIGFVFLPYISFTQKFLKKFLNIMSLYNSPHKNIHCTYTNWFIAINFKFTFKLSSPAYSELFFLMETFAIKFKFPEFICAMYSWTLAIIITLQSHIFNFPDQAHWGISIQEMIILFKRYTNHIATHQKRNLSTIHATTNENNNFYIPKPKALK